MRPQDLGIGRLFESVRDAVIVADAQTGRIVLWNPAATRIFGYSSSEALELNVETIVPERLRDRHRAGLDRYRESGHGIYIDSGTLLELPALRRSGEEIRIELSLSPVESADEGGRFVLAIIRDITGRERAEEEVRRLNEELENRVAERTAQLEAAVAGLKNSEKTLRESEERFRLLVEGVKDYAIFTLDPHGRVTTWNEGARRIKGYRREEILWRHFSVFYPEEDRERGRPERDLGVAANEGAYEEEGWRVREDGSRFWANVLITALRDDAGQLRGFSNVTRDITGQREVEEALRKSEDRLRLAVESTGLGTWDFNPVTGVLRWDDRCKAMFGLPPEAGVDYEVFLEGLHPEDRERAAREVRRALDLSSGGRFDTEYRTIGIEDGVERWVAARGQAFFDEEGRAVRFVGTVLDVTERKRAEEAQRFLAEASAMLSSSLDYQSTLTNLARLAVPYVADWCAVDVIDEEDGSIHRVTVAHEDPEKVALAHELQERYPPEPDAAHGVAGVLRTGQPEFAWEFPDALLDEADIDDEYREILRGLGVRSYIIVPLIARGRTLGAITLVSAESGRRYGETELELAEELARRAALAVDNARLFKSRSEIARTLQGSLLPSRLPEVPGVEVGLRYLPAGEVDVGGDFYDLFDARVDEEAGSEGSAWGVVIGDVCGKGAQAAAVLAFARYTIRAVARYEARPSAVLAGLNENMLRQRRERDDYKFCTIAYVRLETGGEGAGRGARITVSRGGHSVPFLLQADGSIRKVGHPGRALGVFDDANLTEQEASLTPGDSLVLYTDGVLEARSPDGAFFGEERFTALLRSCAGLDASTIAGRIERDVLEFQEYVTHDDVAVLVLRIPD